MGAIHTLGTIQLALALNNYVLLSPSVMVHVTLATNYKINYDIEFILHFYKFKATEYLYLDKCNTRVECHDYGCDSYSWDHSVGTCTNKLGAAIAFCYGPRYFGHQPQHQLWNWVTSTCHINSRYLNTFIWTNVTQESSTMIMGAIHTLGNIQLALALNKLGAAIAFCYGPRYFGH